MATPQQKLDLLFGGDDWTVAYQVYSRQSPFPNDPTRQDERLTEALQASGDPQFQDIEQLKQILNGKSNEFVINAATLFEELLLLNGDGDRFINPSPAESLPINRGLNIQQPQEQSMNIRGQFRMSDSSGNFIDYVRGDVVYYEGKTYIASRNVSGWVPESKHPENGWQPIDLPDETIDGSEF